MANEIIRPNRRGFLTGLASLIAAPAIIKATSLMPISVPKSDLILPYTGKTIWDATAFYCPYVPLQFGAPSPGYSFIAGEMIDPIKFTTIYGVINAH